MKFCWQGSLRGEEIIFNQILGLNCDNKAETLQKREEMSANLPRNIDFYSQKLTLQKAESRFYNLLSLVALFC